MNESPAYHAKTFPLKQTPKQLDELANFPVHLLCFFISPAITLAVSLLNYRTAVAKNITWLFCGFYGLCYNLQPFLGVDAMRYAADLRQMHRIPTSLESVTSNFYREGSFHFDVFSGLLTFFVSRFTDDYRFFFGLLGLIYGFFFSRVIWFFIERAPSSHNWLLIYYLTFMAFVMDLGSGLNGVRMWTAMFVFLFGVLFYWETARIGYLVIAGLSIFIHFSFAAPVAAMLATGLASRFPLGVLIFFLASFLGTAIDVAIVRSIVQLMPGLEDRVEGYLAGTANEKDFAVYIIYSQRMMQAFCFISAIVQYWATPVKSPLFKNTFTFTLILHGCVNMLWAIGSIYRFYVMTNILFVGLWVLILAAPQRPKAIVDSLLALLVPLTLLEFALGVRFFLGYVHIGLILGNPVTTFWFEADYSIYDMLPIR